MSGRGKGGKGLGKKQRVAEYEWKAGEDVFEVAYMNNGDCEMHIFTVPLSKMDPVLQHVYTESGAKKFVWDLSQEETLDDLFEHLNAKQFEKLTSEDDDDGEGEEEEEDEEEEEIEDKDEVIDHIRDWISNLSDKLSDPVGVPVNILCKFGICESV
jgi:chemotaxis protein histidine kinase CheA